MKAKELFSKLDRDFGIERLKDEMKNGEKNTGFVKWNESWQIGMEDYDIWTWKSL